MLILMVDDEPALCELLTTALGEAGHETVCATNGAEALECIGQRRFDAIVSDDMMPVMDGSELRAKLLERGDTTFFVLTSGRPVAVMRERCPSCDAYLQKPFPIRDLFRVLRGVDVRRTG